MSPLLTIVGPLPRDEAERAFDRWREEHPEAAAVTDREIVRDLFFTADGREICRYRWVDPRDHEPELDARGNNLSLLECSLARTPEQRFRLHERALRLAGEIEGSAMREMESLLKRLAKAKVELVAVGGFAAMIHGAVRLTLDLDVCAEFSQENLARLITALEGTNARFQPPARRPMPTDPEELEGSRDLCLTTDLGELDVRSEITGIGGYRQTLAASVEVELEGLRFRTLSLDALIEAKTALRRPKDLDALAELRTIRERLASD